MTKLSISEAARACGVARTTIQRAVKTGRLSLDAEHQVDTAELLRLGYQVDAAVLHAASQHSSLTMQQDAAPQRSTPPRRPPGGSRLRPGPRTAHISSWLPIACQARRQPGLAARRAGCPRRRGSGQSSVVGELALRAFGQRR
jgi:hypothetical protein